MKYFAIALQYFPYVLAGVQAVESTIASAPGATKKATVMAAVQAASKAGETVPEQHVSVISGLIDSIVSTLNTTGWFQKSAAAPVAK